MIGYLVRNDEGAQGKVPGCNALGRGDHIRYDAVQFGGKPFARSSKAAHDLIHDQQDAMLVAQGPYFFKIVRRVLDATGGAALAFHEDGGNVPRPLEFDDPFDMRYALAPAR